MSAPEHQIIYYNLGKYFETEANDVDETQLPMPVTTTRKVA